MQSTAGNKEECPPFIKPPFEVNEANFPVFIYDSWFKLKNRKDEFTIGGRIDFNWFPNPEPFFTGKSKATTNLLNMSNLVNRFDLIIDSITFGKAFITAFLFSNLPYIL